MPNVFEYADYRAYLNDYYAEQKAANGSCSYQALAQRAGLKNRGFLHSVMKGTKNLSAESAARLARVVTESQQAAEYFELLVAFARARGQREKERLFAQLNSVKSGKTGASRVRELRQDQFEFYATWYHAAVRAIITPTIARDGMPAFGSAAGARSERSSSVPYRCYWDSPFQCSSSGSGPGRGRSVCWRRNSLRCSPTA